MKLYRDDKGRFVQGHECLSVRDKKTGRFLSRKLSDETKPRYLEVREKIDSYLENYGSGC